MVLGGRRLGWSSMVPESEYRKETHGSGYRILNVGCGDDTFGTQRLDFAGGRGVTEIGLATSMPFKDASFDEVFGSNVLEHMPNALDFVLECRRVLKPGGRLVLKTDHAAYLGYHLLGSRPGDYHTWHGRRPDDRHYGLYSVGHLRNLMAAANLEVYRLFPYTDWTPKSVWGRLLGLVLPWVNYPRLWLEARRPGS